MDYVIGFITTSGQEESETIARVLLDKKLAACVNIVPKVSSLFLWEGKIDSSDESLMVIKTKKQLAGELIEEVRKHHSYDVFEAICMPVVQGNRAYLDWIDEELKKD